jgi:NADP-dependent aldehyde dehydrogenase
LIFPKKLQKEYSELAIQYAKSITVGSGQFCTNPGIIISFKSDYFDLFINKLVQEIQEISPSCMLHPNIYNAYNLGLQKIKKNKNVSELTSYSDKYENNFPRHVISRVSAEKFIEDKCLQHEIFGPCSLIITCQDEEEILKVIESLDGQLTGTILAQDHDTFLSQQIIDTFELKVGRIIFNGVPTGVEVCSSMTHGGPYPASTDSRFTAVGINSIKRWLRPVSYQDFPQSLLPDELKNDNPLNINRIIDGVVTREGDSHFENT